MFVQRRRITANDEVEIAEEATDLLFEAEDVAELISEVTEEVVEVSVDGEDVIFNVGDEEFVVTPEGDEEILESSTKVLKGKKPVKANRRTPAKKAPVKASTSRVVRKVRK